MKIATIQAAKKLFEYHEDAVCETCNKVTREAFYSFGEHVWSEPNTTKEPLYLALSDVIHGAEVDEDSAYRFVVQALDAIQDMIDDNFDVNLEEDYDSIDSYAEAPIYNSELTSWFAKGTNYTYVDDAVREFGWDEGIIQAIQQGYSEAWKEVYLAVVQALQKVEEGK